MLSYYWNFKKINHFYKPIDSFYKENSNYYWPARSEQNEILYLTHNNYGFKAI